FVPPLRGRAKKHGGQNDAGKSHGHSRTRKRRTAGGLPRPYLIVTREGPSRPALFPSRDRRCLCYKVLQPCRGFPGTMERSFPPGKLSPAKRPVREGGSRCRAVVVFPWRPCCWPSGCWVSTRPPRGRTP